MNRIFIIQLIASFIIGGCFIAAQSYIAEKVSEKTAGIVLAFPSTMGLGFFFLGWVLTPEVVSSIVPSTILSLGLVTLFPTVYYFAARLFRKVASKKMQILLSVFVGLLFWFVQAIPIAYYEINNLGIGIAAFCIAATMSFLLIFFREADRPKPPSVTYTKQQLVGRAVFIGFIIFIITLFGKTLGPFWGGIFTMFPAAYISTFIILHWYYNADDILSFIRRIPIGSLSFLVYTLMIMYTFPVLGFIGGTIAAYLASLITSYTLVKIQRA